MKYFGRWTYAAAFSAGICFWAIGAGPMAIAADDKAPHFKVAADWPKPLPNNWILGPASGIAVDKDNHIWVLQRPRSLAEDELGAAQNPPRSICCLAAPPVLVFDTQGNLLKYWGGPGPGYDWPATEHGIFVEQSGSVWISGHGNTDRHALKFTGDGKFLLEIGHPGPAAKSSDANSLDTTMLGRVAGIAVDEKAHEVYFADGYLNKRVIVFDSETGTFKRMWGAYGNPPEDNDLKYRPGQPPARQFGPLHCVGLSNDELVYVCDRGNDRIQVFTKQGRFVKEFIVAPLTLGNQSTYNIAFSRDKEQKYLFVQDGENNVIWELRRSDGAVLGKTGRQGRNAGEFHHIHAMAQDSAGNLYTGEITTGNRVQKFVPVPAGGNTVDQDTYR